MASEDGGPILVADGDARSRTLISSLLRRVGYLTLEAQTGEEALEAAARERLVCVILDVRLPGTSGYEVCRELRDTFGETLPIVFLSGDRIDPSDQVAGLLVGADDYIVKPFAHDELLARLRRLITRSRPVAPAIASKLTPRELQVLSLLVEGRQQREIANALFISPKTVAKHIEHILAKLGVHTRAQAVALASRARLVRTGS